MSELSRDCDHAANPARIDEALAQMKRAETLLVEGRSFEALRLAEQTAASLPELPGMHYLRAVCLIAQDRFEEALEAIRAELRHDPDHPEAQRQLASLTRRTQSLDKPRPAKIPTEERPWGTELARESLLEIQNATGGYTYRGVAMVKNPFDVALYPLLLWNLKPKSIIEIGSNAGGSALWFADLLDNFGVDGHVFSLDILKVKSVTHRRVTFLQGDGRALPEILPEDFLKSLPRPFLIVEDADHTYETTHSVLEFFHQYLVRGEYFVIEDGISSDIYEIPDHNSGPHRALKQFLAEHRGEYEIDGDYCDFFGYNFTWCTNGFLKKIAAGGTQRP